MKRFKSIDIPLPLHLDIGFNGKKEKTMKKRLFILAEVAVLLVVVFIIVVKVAALYSQPRTASASADSPVPQSQDLAIVQSTAAATDTPPSGGAYPLVQKVNGVKMELLGTAIVDDYFTADVCYDFPTFDPEWMIGGMSPEYVTLSNGQETIPVYSMGMIGDLKTDSNGNYTGRCDHLKFPVSPSTNIDNMRITVSRIATTPSETMDCEAAQKRLDDANQRIKIKCTQGAGLSGFVVTSKPQGMDAQTANDIASDAFLEVVQGPWIFDLIGK